MSTVKSKDVASTETASDFELNHDTQIYKNKPKSTDGASYSLTDFMPTNHDDYPKIELNGILVQGLKSDETTSYLESDDVTDKKADEDDVSSVENPPVTMISSGLVVKGLF